jgi:hypothetical protein
MSTAAALKAEVKLVILALEAIARAPHALSGFGDAYKHVGVNFSLEACVIASKITGADAFFCKMLNQKFRTDAAELMFERALAEAA